MSLFSNVAATTFHVSGVPGSPRHEKRNVTGSALYMQSMSRLMMTAFGNWLAHAWDATSSLQPKT